jgi:GTP diphosphokinase / guanosine-3',5'-bis(diphosphate) 3'-diphosphatase
MLKKYFDKISKYNKNFNEKAIEKAFVLLNKKTADKNIIDFALGMVDIILPLKPDDETIISALLYPITPELLGFEEVKEEFGSDVHDILDNSLSLLALNYRANDKASQLEALRKMFLSMAKDLRVVIVELACRLYRIKHIKTFVARHDRLNFARETFDVYVPVASKLGLYRMKVQLEDESFKYLDPENYKDASWQLRNFGKNKKKIIEKIRRKLDDFLIKTDYKCEVFGRLKSVYSIFKKMKRKGLVNIDDLYDVFAMRIIFDSNDIDSLYSLLGLIHSEWKPVSSRFKDYIAVPKPNGYRSLHTVVLELSPEVVDKPVEIQLRNTEMHFEAEYGMASHWLYKQSKSKTEKENLKNQIDWLKGLEILQENLNQEENLIREVEVDVFKDRIFVLTPKGEIKDLPKGAIPIDFAYVIHTDIGHRCLMAKVNGQIAPLDHELKNGDIVEIILKKDKTPKLQWLSMVKTNVAKVKIRAWFNKEDKDSHLKRGRELLNKHLEKVGHSILDQNFSILKTFGGKRLPVSQRVSLVEEIGKGSKVASDVIRKVLPYNDIVNIVKTNENKARKDKSIIERTRKSELTDEVLLAGTDFLPIKLASCCKPKQGGDIFGYVTRGNRVTIHRRKCRYTKDLDENRIIDAAWKSDDEDRIHRRRLKVMAMPRVGLIRDLSSVIVSLGANIVDMQVDAGKNDVNVFNFFVDFLNVVNVDNFVSSLEKVKNVMQVLVEE